MIFRLVPKSVTLIDKTITMNNLLLLCLVVNVLQRDLPRRLRYKCSITARWKFCCRFINSRLNATYLPSYHLITQTFASSSPDEFLFNFGPNHIIGIGEARHFKLRVLIDIKEY